jgi:hypothetical protein
MMRGLSEKVQHPQHRRISASFDATEDATLMQPDYVLKMQHLVSEKTRFSAGVAFFSGQGDA